MRKLLATVVLIPILAGPLWAQPPTTQPATGPATSPADARAVEPALDHLLDVERKAYAVYIAIQAKYGHVPPLPMIIGSEQFHLATLQQELEDRHLAVPPDPWKGKAAEVPADRAGIYTRGMELERETIAAYDQAIAAVSDPDLKDTLDLLRLQSQQHLRMFSHHAGMGGGMMGGMRGGMGGGMRGGMGPMGGGMMGGGMMHRMGAGGPPTSAGSR